jgi:hypothetical protein
MSDEQLVDQGSTVSRRMFIKGVRESTLRA